MKKKKSNLITCWQARSLMITALKNDPAWITNEERRVFHEHLNRCWLCTEEYRETLVVMDLLKQHWQFNPDQQLSESNNPTADPHSMAPASGPNIIHVRSIKEAWMDFQYLCPVFVGVEFLDSKNSLSQERSNPKRSVPRWQRFINLTAGIVIILSVGFLCFPLKHGNTNLETTVVTPIKVSLCRIERSMNDRSRVSVVDPHMRTRDGF